MKTGKSRKMITRKKHTRNSNTFIRYWVSKLPWLAPTRPPKPGPVMGISGLWDFNGSFNIFSRWRLRLGWSLNSGKAWGLWITGFASKSSIDFFLGARATQTRAPLSLRVGSYSTWVPPWLLSPTVAKIFTNKKKFNKYYKHKQQILFQRM